jgi:Arc/MetJ-type ribon-helix-helix transcriptional regulator
MLREQVEAAALANGETISDFVESAVRRALDHRALQAEFYARGQAASAHFEQSGVSHSTDDVMQELRQMTAKRRHQLLAVPQE